MAMALCAGKMGLSMRACGQTICILEEGSSITPMEMSTKENLTRIWPVDSECISTLMDRNTLATGKMTSLMGLGGKFGLMAALTRGTTRMPLKRARESTSGRTRIGILENGRRIRWMGWAYSSGMTVRPTLEIGGITLWMERDA